MNGMGLEIDKAYIAITKDNLVDGACFTQSEDAEQWVKDMKASGMKVQKVNRKYAKQVLYTTIKQASLLA